MIIGKSKYELKEEVESSTQGFFDNHGNNLLTPEKFFYIIYADLTLRKMKKIPLQITDQKTVISQYQMIIRTKANDLRLLVHK